MADYRIDLGVQLNKADLSKIKTDLNNMHQQKKINLEINKKQIDSQLNSIRKQIQNLSNIKINIGGNSNGSINPISIDTTNITKSFNELKNAVIDIKNVLGTVDDTFDAKTLVSSINQIANTLGKATDESQNLVNSLNALSKKDFSFNFGFNMGKSASQLASEQGDLKRDAISQLKQQAKALEDYFDQYYKVTQQGEGIARLTQGTNVFRDYWELSPNIGDTKASLKQQVATYKQYIDLMQQAAKIKGIDLSGVTSGFSKTTDDIVNKTKSATNNVEQFSQALKGLLSSGIDSESLTQILGDLNEIKTSLQSLAGDNAIEGLIQSFNTLSQTLDKLIANAGNIKVVLDNSFDGVKSDAEQTTQAIKKTADAIEKVNQTANSGSSTSGIENIGEESKEAAGEVGLLEEKLSKFKNAFKSGFSGGSLDSITRDFEELGLSVTDVTSKIDKNDNIVITVKGLDKAKEAVTVIGKLSKETKNIDIDVKVDDNIGKIKEKLKFNDSGLSGYDVEISKVESSFSKLSVKSEELKHDIQSLRTVLSDIVSADVTGDMHSLISANEKYEEVLKSVNNQLKINRQVEQDARADSKLTQDRTNLSLKMDNWLKDNSAAAKQFGSKIKELQAELKSCNNVRLDGIKREFTEIQRSAQLAGKNTQTLGDRLKTQFQKYSAYLGVAELIMYTEQALRDMFEQVKAIDSAMTELKKVTDETDATYDKFLGNAAERAKKIGTTIDGLVDSTAEFAKIGYGFEDSQELAEVANIYKLVGDNIESAEVATQSLISTMAAFKDEMNGMDNADFAMSIVDKFNEVSNEYSIGSGGLGEALTRSASSMAAANNTLDETIALITAANEVVQNPEKIGNGLKTISMRIRGAKTQLEEAGESTEGMAESTASLRAEIMALSGVDIMLDKNTFKSTYAIMEELSQRWEGLSDIAQAKCLPEYVEIHIVKHI